MACLTMPLIACGRLGYEAHLWASEAGSGGDDAAFDAASVDEGAAPAGDSALVSDVPAGDSSPDVANNATEAPINLSALVAEGWKVVFSSAFDATSPQFPATAVSQCGRFGSLLGGAGILGLKDKLTLRLDLPAHRELHVVFDLVVIDSWDDEVTYLNVDNKRAAQITCGKSESARCNRTSNECGSDVAENLDGQVRVQSTLTHTTSNVDIAIGAILDQVRPDESWGLNNLAVLMR